MHLYVRKQKQCQIKKGHGFERECEDGTWEGIGWWKAKIDISILFKLKL